MICKEKEGVWGKERKIGISELRSSSVAVGKLCTVGKLCGSWQAVRQLASCIPLESSVAVGKLCTEGGGSDDGTLWITGGGEVVTFHGQNQIRQLEDTWAMDSCVSISISSLLR